MTKKSGNEATRSRTVLAAPRIVWPTSSISTGALKAYRIHPLAIRESFARVSVCSFLVLLLLARGIRPRPEFVVLHLQDRHRSRVGTVSPPVGNGGCRIIASAIQRNGLHSASQRPVPRPHLYFRRVALLLPKLTSRVPNLPQLQGNPETPQALVQGQLE